MNTGDLLLLQELEKGIPLVPNPYAEIAQLLGRSEQEVISRITALQHEGIIRRVRARMNQRRIGISANALVAWNIPEEKVDSVGIFLSGFPEVTHCYRRKPVPDKWEYSLYTVHHGWTRTQVIKEVARISDKIGNYQYRLLFSTEEYKRVPHTTSHDLEA